MCTCEDEVTSAYIQSCLALRSGGAPTASHVFMFTTGSIIKIAVRGEEEEEDGRLRRSQPTLEPSTCGKNQFKTAQDLQVTNGKRDLRPIPNAL